MRPEPVKWELNCESRRLTAGEIADRPSRLICREDRGDVDGDDMSDDECPWGYSSVWDDAVRNAEDGDLTPLIDLLRTTIPSLARLLERGKFKLRPEEQPKEIDFALWEAACQVQALCAVLEEHRKLARLNKGKIRIFDKDGRLNPLLQSYDDPLVLTASPAIKRNLHMMSRYRLIEKVAEERGLDRWALDRFLNCYGRNYRRLLGRK